jgi:GT2 family glycosyltransferase
MITTSVIIPFHRNVAMLARVVAPFSERPAHVELIIAADGATEAWQPIADGVGARSVALPVRSGPAAARNLAATVARGSVLVFVDGDVVAAPTALARIERFFETRPEVDAVFGAYDEDPEAPGLVSQFRNLGHRYVHCTTEVEARTFWAGLGAVRTAAFRRVGGFDASFTRPCVEDIELGYRLSSAGHRIVVEPSIEGKHLKTWTFANSVRSDLVDRGIPWTQLLLRVKSGQRDLNLTSSLRLSVVLAYLVVLAGAAGLVWRREILVAVPMLLAGLVALNASYYRYFALRRGLWFAAAVVPLHLVHHLCNGVSFVVGHVLFHVRRTTGVALAGSLPTTSPQTVRGADATEGKATG